MEEDLYVRNKSIFKPKTAETFEEYECEWKMADNESMVRIIETLSSQAESAEMDSNYTKESTTRILRAIEQSKLKI